MTRLIGLGAAVIFGGLNGTRQDHKEKEHTKKVKDFDRAVKRRKKLFGSDAVGNPNDKPNPKHIVRKGRALGGRQMEVNRDDAIKALAKDNVAVQKAQQALAKKK